MGRYTHGLLMAHELGHAFNLSHTTGPGSVGLFDTTNVMHNNSSSREYLTEGQNYRVVYDALSSINDLYRVREGQPTRACPHHYVESNLTCPPIQKRIWADGASWPPN
jgi:hypothetical protein